ncbi:PEP-CTERM sorting domain-containing protein [Zavarzinella formosa]|uniref:PEP-CTERM sorting domain-containing protein n=1 Tax=Zavarzinella formosa TaxID=360055 RepID=UPI0002F5FD73|nr:PEP-CTERM sorting domain-containing protein [Zavarzinella formosa]
MSLIRKLGLAALFATVLGSTASAGLVPLTTSVVSEGDNFRYTYGVTLSSNNFLNKGDSFVIYDFAGFVPSSSDQPAGFSFSTAATSPDHGRTAPNDNPNVQNLVWTYTGDTPLIGEIGIGDFSALSTKPEASAPTDFTSRTHVIDQFGNMVSYDSITSTTAPAGSDTTPPPPGVPEPSTLLLLSAGLPIALGVRYLKNRKLTTVA